MARLVSQEQAGLKTKSRSEQIKSKELQAMQAEYKKEYDKYQAELTEYNRQLEAYEIQKAEYDLKVAEAKKKYGTSKLTEQNGKLVPYMDYTAYYKLYEQVYDYEQTYKIWKQAYDNYDKVKNDYDSIQQRLQTSKDNMAGKSLDLNSIKNQTVRSYIEDIHKNNTGKIGNDASGQISRAQKKIKEITNYINKNKLGNDPAIKSALDYVKSEFAVKSYTNSLNNFLKDAKIPYKDNPYFQAHKYVVAGIDKSVLENKYKGYLQTYEQKMNVLKDTVKYDSKRDYKESVLDKAKKLADQLGEKAPTSLKKAEDYLQDIQKKIKEQESAQSWKDLESKLIVNYTTGQRADGTFVSQEEIKKQLGNLYIGGGTYEQPKAISSPQENTAKFLGTLPITAGQTAPKNFVETPKLSQQTTTTSPFLPTIREFKPSDALTMNKLVIPSRTITGRIIEERKKPMNVIRENITHNINKVIIPTIKSEVFKLKELVPSFLVPKINKDEVELVQPINLDTKSPMPDSYFANLKTKTPEVDITKFEDIKFKPIEKSDIEKQIELKLSESPVNYDIKTIPEVGDITRFKQMEYVDLKFRGTISDKPLFTPEVQDWYEKKIFEPTRAKFDTPKYDPRLNLLLFGGGVIKGAGEFGRSLFEMATKPVSTLIEIKKAPIQTTVGWIPESFNKLVSGSPSEAGEGVFGVGLAALGAKQLYRSRVPKKQALPETPTRFGKKYTPPATSKPFQFKDGMTKVEIERIRYDKTYKDIDIFKSDPKTVFDQPTTKALQRKEYKLNPNMLEQKLVTLELSDIAKAKQKPEVLDLYKKLESKPITSDIGIFNMDIKTLLDQPTAKALERFKAKDKPSVLEIDKRQTARERLKYERDLAETRYKTIDDSIIDMNKKYAKELEKYTKDYADIKESILYSEKQLRSRFEDVGIKLDKQTLATKTLGKESGIFNMDPKTVFDQPTTKALQRYEGRFKPSVLELERLQTMREKSVFNKVDFGKPKTTIRFGKKYTTQATSKPFQFKDVVTQKKIPETKDIVKKPDTIIEEFGKTYREIEILNRDGTVSVMLEEIKVKPKVKTIQETIEIVKPLEVVKTKPIELTKTKPKVQQKQTQLVKSKDLGFEPLSTKTTSISPARISTSSRLILISLINPRTTSKTNIFGVTTTVKEKTITLPKERVLQLEKAKVVELIKPIELTKTKEQVITLEKVISLEKVKTIELTKPIEIVKSDVKNIEIVDTLTKTKQKQKQLTETIQKEKTKLRKRIDDPSEQEQIPKGGYNVQVREKGKFVKVNEKPLVYDQADKLGRIVTENTEAVSYKLTKASKDGSTDTGLSNKYYVPPRTNYTKEKKNKNVFVEKERYRINTTGEIKGVTAKGWLAQESKKNTPITWSGFKKTPKPLFTGRTQRTTNVSDSGITKRVMASKQKFQKDRITKALNTKGLFREI